MVRVGSRGVASPFLRVVAPGLLGNMLCHSSAQDASWTDDLRRFRGNTSRVATAERNGNYATGYVSKEVVCLDVALNLLGHVQAIRRKAGRANSANDRTYFTQGSYFKVP